MPQLTFSKISWQQLEADCIELAQKMKNIQIDTIVAISRGGLVAARILSDLLKIPISHITISSYDDLKQSREPEVTEVPSTNFQEKTILIVDEVSDSGETFVRALQFFEDKKIKKSFTLAPYIKQHTKYTPDFYVHSTNNWIIFPYELRETFEAFGKMFGLPKQAKDKLLEVGFEEWEIAALYLDQHKTIKT